MSLEEKLYNQAYEVGYDNCEFDNKSKRNGFSRMMLNLGNYMKYITIAGAAYFTSALYALGGGLTMEENIIVGGFALGGLGLTVHFDKIKEICQGINRKNKGETLSCEEISEIKKKCRIGKYAHLGTLISILGGIELASIKAFITTEDVKLITPMLALPALGCLINRVYSGIYNSFSDYISGEKRAPQKDL